MPRTLNHICTSFENIMRNSRSLNTSSSRRSFPSSRTGRVSRDTHRRSPTHSPSRHQGSSPRNRASVEMRDYTNRFDDSNFLLQEKQNYMGTDSSALDHGPSHFDHGVARIAPPSTSSSYVNASLQKDRDFRKEEENMSYHPRRINQEKSSSNRAFISRQSPGSNNARESTNHYHQEDQKMIHPARNVAYPMVPMSQSLQKERTPPREAPLAHANVNVPLLSEEYHKRSSKFLDQSSDERYNVVPNLASRKDTKDVLNSGSSLSYARRREDQTYGRRENIDSTHTPRSVSYPTVTMSRSMERAVTPQPHSNASLPLSSDGHHKCSSKFPDHSSHQLYKMPTNSVPGKDVLNSSDSTSYARRDDQMCRYIEAGRREKVDSHPSDETHRRMHNDNRQEKEKMMYSPRSVSYPMVPTSLSLERAVTHRQEESLAPTNISRPLPSYGLHKCNSKFSDHSSHQLHRMVPNSVPERDQKDMLDLVGSPSYSRSEHQVYGHTDAGRREKLDSTHSSDGICRVMQPSDLGDPENRVSSRKRFIDLDVDTVNARKCSHRRFGEGILWENRPFIENSVPYYLRTTNKFATTTNAEHSSTGSKYLEFGERVIGGHPSFTPSGAYGFETGEALGVHKERPNSPPRHERNLDMYTFDGSPQGSLKVADVDACGFLDRVQGRHSNIDEDITRSDSWILSSNSRDISKKHELADVQEHLNEEDIEALVLGRYRSLNVEEHISEQDIDALVQGRYRSLNAENVDAHDLFHRVHGRKSSIDEVVTRHNFRSLSSNSRDISRKHELADVEKHCNAKDTKALPSYKTSVFSRLEQKKIERSCTERDSCRVPESQCLISAHGKGLASEPGTSNCTKKGLAPVSLILPAPNDHSSCHIITSQKRKTDDLHSRGDADNDRTTKGKVVRLKTVSLEVSQNFKQLVHKAFLRFSKHLNETSAQRRRYMEPGKDGVLCSICGSNAKKFFDTRSLASHAYASSKGATEADHLGLHKALCVLMGWNSDFIAGNTWKMQVLPDAEALAQRENLILWPPIVIIHNSSIGRKNPDEQKVVTIEEMEAILGDLGFSTGATTICRGKPANQSIMVVKFKPTLSGLQEAERLHQYYDKNKRGREGFQQISCSSEKSKESDGGKLELVLYGYLGISDDLDKLEIETKKRCVVESKKDILELADAPLKSD